jgi:hypothetical protein
LTSYRTYTDPADPGQSPTYSGLFSPVQAPFRSRGSQVQLADTGGTNAQGVIAESRHVRRTVVHWTPPRYRYWYTTPRPLTAPPVRQRQRGDSLAGGAPRQRQVPSASVRQGPGRVL